MRVLLLSGLGPTFKNSDYLDGTMLDPEYGRKTAQNYLAGSDLSEFQLNRLGFRYGGREYALLRSRKQTVPHLTTFTLECILEQAGVEFDHFSTLDIWEGSGTIPGGDYDAVLLSTSYIWNASTLRMAVSWVSSNFPGVLLVLGGQYSNLKYASIMRDFPGVDVIVRGDSEEALPRLLHALAHRQPVDGIPNLVVRGEGGRGRNWTINPFEYIDLDAFPSPMPRGRFPVVPYESMRGCPFTCKFCSFPAASPKWRYKSAQKIAEDWARYSEETGASFIKAMDSTFTVPPTRLRELLTLLPGLGVEWEGYSRANVIKTPELVAQLAESHCRFLSLGFESMSDSTLKYMDKKVNRKQNLRAFELLRSGGLGFRCSFMTGYPGETPEDFELTRDFLVEEYAGHFMLSVFSVSDETMPLWQDKERLQIEIHDPENPDYSWSHIGMDVEEARSLNHQTLTDVRLKNDSAVLMLWQGDFEHWFVPHLGSRDNLAIEKTIERIGMAPKDYPDQELGVRAIQEHLDVLRGYGIEPMPESALTGRSLLEVAI
ncbi:B12-binding domain-containing radical SAM protein [Streptomyces sp. NPDC020707]|uniref:B12-binding domain-containing radical SAM protein n=1 Tax=Streptomyces sp. NPDC020707 TaxID=3365084 RepID=UPI003798E028